MKGQKTSDEARAAALAALMAGQGVSEVARQYKLPKSTVSDLKNKIAPQEFGQVRTEKREAIADLVVDHLRASLKAATAIADEVSRPEYIKRQPADAVAVLFGVLTDKSIRMLEAAAAATEAAVPVIPATEEEPGE